LDENSYQACINAIDRAHYFVLFIGSRVGGYYNRPDRVSITRMEYRKAYERQQQGRIQLISFVRKELWDIREDRDALKKFISENERVLRELGDNADSLVYYSSKFVTDAEATYDFLDEVRRAEEMAKAASGAGPFPVGNWIHTFSEFRDVVETITVQFKIKRSLKTKALVLNLREELLANVGSLVTKSDKTIIPNAAWADGLENISRAASRITAKFPAMTLNNSQRSLSFSHTRDLCSQRYSLTKR